MIRLVKDLRDFPSASSHCPNGFLAAMNECARRFLGTRRKSAVGLLKHTCDVFGPGEQGVGSLLGTFRDPAVGIGKGLSGFLVKSRRDFHDLVAQCACNDDRAPFQNLTHIVDAGRKRTLHSACAFLDDSSLTEEGFLDFRDVRGKGF